MRQKIRYLFILIFPLLLVQMYYCYHYPEPFPAIMMPRFGHQQPDDKGVSYLDVALVFVTKDGSEMLIDRHQLFSDMHLPQRFFAVKKVFALDADAEQDTAFLAWLRPRIKAMVGADQGQLQATWSQIFLSKNSLNQQKKLVGIKTIDLP